MKQIAVIGFLLVAFLGGIGLVVSPGLAIPLSLESLALGGITLLAVSRLKDERRDLVLWILVWAFVLRMAVLLVVHFVFDPEFFAPDAVYYETVGRQIALSWRGLAPRPIQASQGLPTYFDLNAAFHFVLGDSSIGVPILNLFSGVWTVLLAYLIAREITGPVPARWTAFLAATFPSLVLWSILNIRDALATFAVTAIVLLSVRIMQGVRANLVLLLLLAFVALQALRDYMAFLVAAGVVLGALAATGKTKLGPTLLLGVAASAFAALLSRKLGLFQEESLDAALNTANQIRLNLGATAGSSFGTGSAITSLGEALAFLPTGFAFLLFAPFPWRIESSLQLAAMPETLLWYPLFLLSLAGVRRVAKGPRREWLLPASVLLVVVASYAFVEGNFGTAYRHRAQIMPLFFVFASIGAGDFFRWLRVLGGRGARSRIALSAGFRGHR